MCCCSVYNESSTRQHQQFNIFNKMQFQFKFQVICLCLIWCQVLGQDIRPEFPEDFPKTTTAAAAITTTAAATTTELPTTTTATTTTAATTELTANTTPTATITTITAATTNRPTTTRRTPTTRTPKTTRRTPTTTRRIPTTTQPPFTTWQPYYPTFVPPTSPPHFTPAYHWLWDLEESVEQQRCYLRDQVERSRGRWSCGSTSLLAVVNCYRCCYYGNSRFAGCNKLHSGRCNSVSSSWQI